MSEPLTGLEVAVIGMAARLPGAEDVARFWENLRAGVESIRFHPNDNEIPGLVPAAARVDGVELFDAAFWGYSPREAEQLDPQHRLFLECAWEALESAGLDPAAAPKLLVGVYAGAAANEYLFFNLLQSGIDPGAVLSLAIGNEKDFLATRASYKLDLKGPSLSVQTGCSSSLVAVHLACQALISYQCDAALAGGVALQLGPPGYVYQPGGILSADGHCRAFSADASGAVAGSGAGVVVLKRLADAMADGDRIRAVIKGSAVNNDGAAKLGYTAPSIEGQARVIDLALAAAGVEPRSISYVETHGSGTPLGDPIEVAALTRAFRAGTADRGFCALGSVKTNIGHLDTAAGVAGLIKTVLALENREIPPSLHFAAPNPEIDFAASPFYVASRLTPWTGTPRRAGVSSFGIGGTNAHVVLEEAPAKQSGDPARPAEVLVLSAASHGALDTATEQLAANFPDDLADAAWTLATGRKRFPYRRAVVARSADDARAALSDPGRILEAHEEMTERPVAFLLPGVGDHYPGMAAGLYRSEPVFRRAIDRCAEILGDVDLKGALAPGDGGGEGIDLRRMLGRRAADSPLARTAIAQPVVFAVELALARLWQSCGVEPVALLGYSLGEYTAACLAGVMSEQDALRVVAERARVIDTLPPGAMLAVPLPEEEARALSPGVALAAVNGPSLSVLSGSVEAIAAVEDDLARRGVSARRLETTHAFHSTMMAPAAEPLRAILRRVALEPPSIPVLSNLTGAFLTAAEATDPEYWARQLCSTVRFADGLAQALADPARVLLEVGPGNSLGSFARQQKGAVVIASLRSAWDGQPDEEVFLAALARLWLAGCNIDWKRWREGERHLKVELPSYPWQRQRYWVEPGPASVAVAETTEEAPRHARPAHLRSVYAAPASELERTVAGMWERFLGVSGIGRHDNFFELGGHSLLGTQLVASARDALGVELELSALFSTPTVAGMAAVAAGLAAARGDAAPPLVALDRDGPLPLSFAQSRMWFLDQLAPGSPAYDIPFALRLEGRLFVGRLAASIASIVARHETLRTRFPAAEGKPAQETFSFRPELPLVDLSALPRPTAERLGERLSALFGSWNFDLAAGPLLAVALLRFAAEDHTLLLNVHHIAADGWSIGVLLGELATLYQGQPLPPLAIQYADFAAWQRGWLSGEALARHVRYWRERLAGRPSSLDLPLDRPRSARARPNAGRQRILLPAEVVSRGRELATRQASTPFALSLAAFAALLSRLSRQDDVLVGTPIANRTRTETESLIGFFVNTLALRIDLARDPTFGEVLDRASSVARGAFAHQDLPFEKLIEELQPERDLAMAPLFQVMLAYQNAPLPKVELPDGLTLLPAESRSNATQFDLTLSVAEAAEGRWLVELEYAAALFDPATAERFLDSFEVLLAAAVEQPEIRLAKLPLLAEAQQHQLRCEWNDSAASTSEVLVHTLVARQDPSALAIAEGKDNLTYGELNARAELLARSLAARGVGPETVVAVVLPRGAALAVSALAVLKAGAAYLPLDPSFPRERIERVVRDSGAALVLDGSELPRGDARAVEPDPDGLAYLIYTSGSTGEPKGVETTHRGLSNLVSWYASSFGLRPGARVSQVASPAFDASVMEMWPALASGASLHVPDEETRTSPGKLRDWLARERITCCFLPTVLADAVLALGPLDSPSLATLVVGGSKLERAPDVPCRAWNLYGPTENSVVSTFQPVAPSPLAPPAPPIGRPVANHRAHVLDAGLSPLPPGVRGELLVGGAGLARGYRGRPELTAERFVPDPWGDGERLYRTGDLVRRLPDGALQFLGRDDQQVKVRGFRVELAEVEAALAALPGVATAAVIAEGHGGNGHGGRLVAYVTGDAEPQSLRRALRGRLPDFMIPSLVSGLDALPTTVQGKVDRSALAAMVPAAASEASDGAPRTPLEERLVALASELLAVPQVGIGESFFDLGGHSLLAAQFVATLAERWGIAIELADLFETASLAELADLITERELLALDEATMERMLDGLAAEDLG